MFWGYLASRQYFVSFPQSDGKIEERRLNRVMNQTSSSPKTIDPAAFAAWVEKIALINEEFSEVLHDTADIVAVLDPTAAVGLYQAADTASETVQALRRIVPPAPTPTSRPLALVGFGLLCAALGGIVARL
jgi:hypothetical protein